MTTHRLFKFKLKSGSEEILLEHFIKGVTDMDDYQEIRHFVKEGNVTVNFRIEKNRRRTLRPGDLLKIADKEFLILDYQGRQPEKHEGSQSREVVFNNAENIYHKKRTELSLKWQEKTITKRKRKKKDD